jgi:hypothetical protein
MLNGWSATRSDLSRRFLFLTLVCPTFRGPAPHEFVQQPPPKMNPPLKKSLCPVLFAALLSACAGPSSLHKVRESRPSGLVLGVKVATVSRPLGQGTPIGALNYEQIALPALLVEELKRTPGITDAVVVLENTPAVDGVMEVEIVNSDARIWTLNVNIKRIDGKVVRSDRFVRVATGWSVYMENQTTEDYFGFYIWPLRLVLEPLFRPVFSPTDPWNPRHIVWPYGNWDKDDAKVIASPAEIETHDLKVIANIAKDASRSLRQYRYDPSELKAAIYSEMPASRLNSRMVKMAEEAAKVEREQVWQPLTDALCKRIAATKGVYYAWKQEAWTFEEKKERAIVEKSNAEALQFLGNITSMAGGMAAGAAAAQGNVQLIAPSINLAVQGAEISAQGQANQRVAENKIKELNAALAKCSEPFNSSTGRQLTIRIYNKVYQFKGSKEEMIKELHRVVKEEISKQAE